MNKEYMIWNDFQSIDLIVKLLADDQVILGDSDTVLGLLANTSSRGRLALDLIKGRDKKPYIILIETLFEAEKFVDKADLIKIAPLLTGFWPGPLTVIFKAKAGVASYLQGENGTIALRVPDHKGLLSILAHFDGLFSTSANLAGQNVPIFIEDVDQLILDKTALIVLDEGLNKAQKLPSTIIDCSQSEIRLVRQGAYSKADIEQILGKSIL
ncbi:MAG: L-threonylcarbamoyladenylate synthase [Candidatus Babeliales bacterium]|nr:L-threonylcarbamoyladenylate synthase [Candidatus Babeliales bacterium]